MINRPLNISPAKPPANPSPTFSPIMCKVAKKTMGAARMKIPLDIFHICLYFFAIKKIRVLKAIRSKRNIMNSSYPPFGKELEFSLFTLAFQRKYYTI